MYVLYRVSDGEKISDSSEPIDNSNPDLAVKQTEKRGIWNPQTLDFDPKPVKNTISHREFIKRLKRHAPGALSTLLQDAKNNIAIEEYFLEFKLSGYVDLSDPDVLSDLNGLTASGRYWTDEQLQAVING